MIARLLLVLLAVALLGLAAGGCGSSSHPQTASQPQRDRDDDGDHGDDDAQYLEYGHAATGQERQTIIALVKEYYAASAAADGAKACRLLMPFVAESVVEDIGHQVGGRTCASVMSKLFKRHIQLLKGENSTLKIYALRVGGGKALAVLSFSVLPEVRQLNAKLDGSRWKILWLLDGIME